MKNKKGNSTLLKIEGLKIEGFSDERWHQIIKGVNLELKRKYQIDLSSMKDEHKERIESLKKLTSENIQKDVLFSELVKFLNVKVEQKELQEYIQKYYGEKIDQRTAETAYGTLLRNKIADESMKTFKIKETKLSLEELMKKGSHNHESGTHSH